MVMLKVSIDYFVDHSDSSYWLVVSATILLYAPNFTVLFWMVPSMLRLKESDNVSISKREVSIQSITFVGSAIADLLVCFDLAFYPRHIAYFTVSLLALTLNFLATAALARTLCKVAIVQLRYERLTCFHESIVSTTDMETSVNMTRGSDHSPLGLSGTLAQTTRLSHHRIS